MFSPPLTDASTGGEEGHRYPAHPADQEEGIKYHAQPADQGEGHKYHTHRANQSENVRTDESSPKCPKLSKSTGIKQCKKNLSESPELRHHTEISKEFSRQTKCEDISPELQEREEILNEFPRSRPLEENLSESDVHRSCHQESSPCQPEGGLFGFTPFHQQGSPQLQHLLPWNPLQFRAPNHPLVGPWDTPYLPQFLLDPRLGFSSPFRPIPHVLERYPNFCNASPIPSFMHLSNTSSPTLLPQETFGRKRRMSAESFQHLTSFPGFENQSLKARILNRSPVSSDLDQRRHLFAQSLSQSSRTVPSLSPASMHSQASTSSPVPGPSQRLSSPKRELSIYRPTRMCYEKGTTVRLANGNMKKIEDLHTLDFLESEKLDSYIKIERTMVIKLELNPQNNSVFITFSLGRFKLQVTIEADVEHPFFVVDQGWSSTVPKLSLSRYQLDCQQLKLGDVCISITNRVSNSQSTLMPPPMAEEPSGTKLRQVPFQWYSSIQRTDAGSPFNLRNPVTSKNLPSSSSRRASVSQPMRIETVSSSPKPEGLISLSIKTGSDLFSKITRVNVASPTLDENLFTSPTREAMNVTMEEHNEASTIKSSETDLSSKPSQSNSSSTINSSETDLSAKPSESNSSPFQREILAPPKKRSRKSLQP